MEKVCELTEKFDSQLTKKKYFETIFDPYNKLCEGLLALVKIMTLTFYNIHSMQRVYTKVLA